MPRVTVETVDHVASLARLSLTPEERSLFARQLDEILAWAESLQAVDVSAVEPLAPAGAGQLREDAAAGRSPARARPRSGAGRGRGALPRATGHRRMSGLVGASAASLRRRVAAREVSCEEVALAHLDAIARVEPTLDAFLAVLEARARETARALDRRLAAGEPAPPLAGVPVAVKDVLHIEGLPTTCGSRVLEGYRPPFTATAVARLEAAGAIVVGKTNMDEFAMGSSTEISAYKPTRNPWDTGRVPGGSSGGSAAAVAARLAPLALGTDTGGSIRQPAAFCGIVGLKPTYGRVSRYGLVAFALVARPGRSPRAHGRGRRPGRGAALRPRPARLDERRRVPCRDLAATIGHGVSGLRIGVPRGFLARGVEPGTMARFEEALAELAAAGRRARGRRPPAPSPRGGHLLPRRHRRGLEQPRPLRRRPLRPPRGRGDSDLRSMYGQTRDAGFGPEVKRRIILGTFALSSGYYDAYYLRAQKVRALIRRDFERAFESCDAVATPTTPSPAFRIGEKTSDPLQMYLEDIFTVPANLAGLPALSLPCGLAAGLPVGLQLLGRPFDEETLLRAGAAYQARTRHHEASPPVCAA